MLSQAQEASCFTSNPKLVLQLKVSSHFNKWAEEIVMLIDSVQYRKHTSVAVKNEMQ